MAFKSIGYGKKHVLVKVVTSNGTVGYLASEIPTVVLEGLLEKLIAGTAALKNHDDVTQTNLPEDKAKRYLKTPPPR